MKSPLLPKGNNFNQMHENLVLRVQSIRKKNDQYQRLNAEQIDGVMAQQILQQKSIMDNQIVQTKRIIQEMESAFKQPMHKNKLKQTKKQYEKQSGRYKQISQALMEKSVIKAEMRNSTNKRNSLPNRNNRTSQQVFKEVRPNRGSDQLAQQQVDVDFDLEHHIIKERNKQLSRAEEQSYRINNVMKDMSNMVDQQGQKVDIIGQQMLKAHQNVEATNDELVSAASQQRKGRRKCFIILFLVVFIVLVVAGAFFLLQKNKSQ